MRNRRASAGCISKGPHIAVDRRGTHKAAYIRPLSADTLDHLGRLGAAGIPTMITVAPEVVTPEQIREITGLGAIVSLGHSAASGDVARQAIAAGARCATHLFNAMPPMSGREPGIAGALIGSDAYAGIICDGIHVAADMVALAIRARPSPDRMFLVSDAMPTVGGPPEFDLYGSPVHLEGRRLVNAEGSLAGAHTTISEGVEYLVSDLGLPVEAALRMAITVPCRAAGLDLDAVEGRDLRDLVVLDGNARFVGSLDDVAAGSCG